MTGLVVRESRASRLPTLPVYVGFCCREWLCPIGYRGGRCGLCGEAPTYLRPDDGSPLNR